MIQRRRSHRRSWASAPASRAAASSSPGTLDGLLHEPRSLTAKYLRDELAIPVPATRRRGDAARSCSVLGATRAQPEGRRRRDSAGTLTVRHRRQRLGQVDARPRRALRGDQAREGRLGPPRRHAPQARRRRVHHRRRARRSGADRPDAALESGHLPQGVRSDPRAVRRDQGRAVARPDREPLLVQRARRPLRGLRGRRRGPRRDAVPRRRLRALRSVRRQALQAAGARGAVPRPQRSTRCST